MRKAGWNERNEYKIKSLALKKFMKFTNIFFFSLILLPLQFLKGRSFAYM